MSERTVAAMLKAAGYSLQANRKTREGASHPDRNAQFAHSNQQVLSFQRRSEPVISVDTKKKELVGEFKNPGQEWEVGGEPTRVGVHDFPDPRLGKAIAYGVYDLASNEGGGSVGIDHDTARFAGASIRRWWQEMGSGEVSTSHPLADHKPTEVEAIAAATDSGRWRCRSWPTTSVFAPLFAIFRLVRANGTRANTVCSASARRIGEVGH